MDNNENPKNIPKPEAVAGVEQDRVAQAEPMTAGISGQVATPSKKSKKGWIIRGVSAGVVALLVTGVALGYKLIYQNPDKVLHDAVSKAIVAKTASYTGVFTVKSDFYNVEINFDGTGDPTQGSVDAKVNLTYSGINNSTNSIKVDGSVIVVDKNIYLKIDGLNKLISSMAIESGADEATMGPVKKIAEKFDGKWVQFSENDIMEYDKEYYKVQTCVTDAVKRLSDNRSANKEIVNLYKDNRFLVIENELGVKDGNFGYEVGVDEAKAAVFVRGLGGTEFGKELTSCDSTIDFERVAKQIESPAGDESRSTSRDSVKVWISRFGHDLKGVNIDTVGHDATYGFELKPEFNKKVGVVAPSEFVKYEELKGDLEEMAMKYFGGLGYGYDAADYDSMTEEEFNSLLETYREN